MKRKLIIDGNAVYEVDEDCMLRRRLDSEREKAEEGKDSWAVEKRKLQRESHQNWES